MRAYRNLVGNQTVSNADLDGTNADPDRTDNSISKGLYIIPNDYCSDSRDREDDIIAQQQKVSLDKIKYLFADVYRGFHKECKIPDEFTNGTAYKRQGGLSDVSRRE